MSHYPIDVNEMIKLLESAQREKTYLRNEKNASKGY